MAPEVTISANNVLVKCFATVVPGAICRRPISMNSKEDEFLHVAQDVTRSVTDSLRRNRAEIHQLLQAAPDRARLTVFESQ